MRNKILMTLALLLTAVTGAWAQEETLLTTIKATGEGSYSETTAGVVTVSHDNDYFDNTFGWLWYEHAGSVTVEAKDGYTITRCVFSQPYKTPFTVSTAPFKVDFIETSDPDMPEFKQYLCQGYMDGVSSIEVYGYAPAPADEPADEPAIDVTPVTGKTNEWTFTMPAFDVEIAPIYAPTAMFATDGNLVLTPTAIEGIYAESTDAIVTPGKVANIGETENPQGTVMYAVTSTNQATAPELTAFSADVPTAKDITVGSDVLVWYYIKGADAPEGEEATAENTFNDSEICATPITVTVLSNKFDIEFKAANDNTIETGKATVTVDGTPATVTEGKLTGVKMGSEVKVKAKDGYKFRKAEAKKGGGAKPLANATTEDLGKVIGADGNIYANKDAAEAANTTAVAMICYVVEGHGLALALTDEVDKMNWSTAQTTCDAHTPAITGGKWMLASKGEWDNMISAAGSYSALRDGFSSVGGTNMQSEGYWSSTEDDSSDAWNYYFSNGLWSDVSKNWNRCVRACLAF